MASMKQYDSAFNKMSKKLSLKGTYSAEHLNFDCLRKTIDHYEQKFVKIFAEAC